MSEENTIVARRLPDGTLVQVLADGSTRLFPPDQTDWAALRSMKDAETDAAALGDPDNPPLTLARQARMKRVLQVKVMRQALGLTQEDFSAPFRIPLGTRETGNRARASPISLTESQRLGRASLSHRHRPRSRGRALQLSAEASASG